MREVHVSRITEEVKSAVIKGNLELGQDMVEALKGAQQKEESPLGKEILGRLLENARIAREERIPICQDTGFVVVFAQVGQDVHLVGGSFQEAIEEGVRRGYKEGYLRKSLCHPFSRKNTGDNTPVIVHTEILP
ncbi:MAG TPA: fumarate hydratase, partial [Desulfobacterales bacterium]|nr:fumarate hydratase [Desulfobacterales bacterium]